MIDTVTSKDNLSSTHKKLRSRKIGIISSNLVLFIFAVILVGRNLVNMVDGDWSAVLFIPHTFLIGILAIIRRPEKKSAKIFSQASLVALCATLIPIGFNVSHMSIAPLYIGGITLQIFAQCFVIYSILNLGKSFGVIPGNRNIVLKGPYRLVRHPIYSGYIFAFTGFLIAHLSLYNIQILCSHVIFQFIRILYEEEILKEDETYRIYQKRVVWRLIPGIL
jgi:protein-S-isoprenylcysteine O-methyltransferase Ste14